MNAPNVRLMWSKKRVPIWWLDEFLHYVCNNRGPAFRIPAGEETVAGVLVWVIPEADTEPRIQVQAVYWKVQGTQERDRRDQGRQGSQKSMHVKPAALWANGSQSSGTTPKNPKNKKTKQMKKKKTVKNTTSESSLPWCERAINTPTPVNHSLLHSAA